jgi:hypothetical protein
MLMLTEQIVANETLLPPELRGLRLYLSDGIVVWCRPEFERTLTGFRLRLGEFLESLAVADNDGDVQEAIESFCRDTGTPKPCFGANCGGDCDTPLPRCPDYPCEGEN